MSKLDSEWLACKQRPDGLYEYSNGMVVRDRGDIGVILDQRHLRALDRFDYTDAVALDIGAHIGSATRYFINRGVKLVVAYEPTVQTAHVLNINFGSHGNVILMIAAMAADVGECEFYLGKTYSATNSLRKFKGREVLNVPTLSFRDELEFHKPNLIKCDIEGGEYLLNWKSIPSFVNEIYLELHHMRVEWVDEGRRIEEDILASGFKPLRSPKHKKGFVPTTFGVWSRRI